MTSRSPRSRAARALTGAVVALVHAGCATWDFSGGAPSLEVASADTGAVLAPRWVTAVYQHADSNTADIYLSDIPLETLASGDLADLDNLSGSILHIRYFVTPRAGRTPISFSASNTVVRHVVFAPASAGVYGGGGFLLPRDDAGEATFEGRMREATVRLVQAAPGFADRLESGEVSGFVSARRDPDAAAAVARTLSNLLHERIPAAASR